MDIANIQIVYADKFDKKNYPIEDWCKKIVVDLSNQLQLTSSTVWTYHATAHGRIFSFQYDVNRFNKSRLNRDTIKHLAQLDQFRWVESFKGIFAVGITHRE